MSAEAKASVPVSVSSTTLGPLELLVIQPTPFCNLNCSYCYLPDRQSKTRISSETLRRTFSEVLSSGLVDAISRAFTVVWHAGEPMALPVAFYEEALGIIAEANSKCFDISHSFQTNGTLITEEWCGFIRQHGIRIGVSIDGPEFLHDRHRKSRAGRGTWERVMAGIQLLQAHRIPFHVITVLTRDSLEHAQELHDFYRANNIRQVGLNVEEVEGVHQSSTLKRPEEGRYRKFLERFLELAWRSEPHLAVREFDSAVAAILSGGVKPEMPLQQTTPFRILSVDCEGRYTTWSPELLGLPSVDYGNFALGNIHDGTLSSVFESERFKTVNSAIQSGVELCRSTCEYYKFCGGGAPVNKYYENGSFATTETVFCRLTKKAVMDVVLEKLETYVSKG